MTRDPFFGSLFKNFPLELINKIVTSDKRTFFSISFFKVSILCRSCKTNGHFSQDQWFKPTNGPKYKQLADHIASLISSGKINEGNQLPAEREFAEIANVSRVTIRQTISLLARKNFVVQRRGAGSFVQSRAQYLNEPLRPQTMNFAIDRSKCQFQGKQVTQPNQDEAQSLDLITSGKIIRFRYLCNNTQGPYAIETVSISENFIRNLGLMIPQQCVFKFLTDNGLQPTRMTQKVTAAIASGTIAKSLGIKTGSPVLLISQTGYLANGQPVKFSNGYYRSDTFNFVSELKLDVS